MKQIGAKRYWNLCVIFIVCDYGVEKNQLCKEKSKKVHIRSIESTFQTKMYLVRTKIIDSKINPYTNSNVSIVISGILTNKFSMG
jgi:hypothetical protein